MQKNTIGITTTIPVEIVYAAGLAPKDLNNIFITSPNPSEYIEFAEQDGLPRNICSWIKAIYSVVMKHDIKRVISVLEGDCSNSNVLMEIFEDKGIQVIPFAYPYDKDRKKLEHEIKSLAEKLGVSENSIKKFKEKCDHARSLIHKIDDKTWQDGTVNGFENHCWQINTSDFCSDIEKFQEQTNEFLKQIEQRQPKEIKYKIGYVGIPPIVSDIYELVETLGGQIVFNEIQRQFSMPYKTDSIVDQYLNYTYPYNFTDRLKDIKTEIKKRKLQGLIHYVQSFCHRQMDDIILRNHIEIPVLTLECDKPGNLSARNKIKLEGFFEIIKSKKLEVKS